MKALVLIALLSSCSPQPSEQSHLSGYSDMGAAADAGRVVSPPVSEGM